MSVTLDQRGRAGLQFLGSLQKFSGGVLQPAAQAEFDHKVPEPAADLTGRRAAAAEALASSSAWKFNRFFTRYVAEEIYVRAIPAAERRREMFEELLDVPADVPGSLELDEHVVVPSYWEPGFHLTPGGWDGHDLMGAIIHDLAYHYVLVPGGVGAVKVGENLNKQRVDFARNAQRDSYRRILEQGAGTGRCMDALATVFPDAELYGLDLSAQGLRRTRALSAELGAAWHLRQAPAEATGYPDDHFDLVAIYTLFHEVPGKATEAILAETLRILEPGGDLLLGDVAPYERQSGFQTVVMDWETENRGEPYWRDALMLDLPKLLTDLGYVDVEAFGMNGGTYPWITRARKPS